MGPSHTTDASAPRTNSDLGFSDALPRHQPRLVNRDGTINVERARRKLTDYATYGGLLQVSWPGFFLLLSLFFVSANLIFGMAYLACGKGALSLNGPDPHINAAWRAFFFSVHTFATIGYGNIVAIGLPANLLVAIESLVGLLTYAIATGLLFARFARPLSRVRFSRYAAIGPTSRGYKALQIRLTNPTRSEMIQLKANLVLSLFDDGPNPLRRYVPLPLERDSVAFMPLLWTLVHPIDKNSPLFGLDTALLTVTRAEILLNVTSVDEASSQTVYSRTSYTATDIAWNSRHADVYIRDADSNLLGVDLTRFDELVVVDPQPAPAETPRKA